MPQSKVILLRIAVIHEQVTEFASFKHDRRRIDIQRFGRRLLGKYASKTLALL